MCNTDNILVIIITPALRGD